MAGFKVFVTLNLLPIEIENYQPLFWLNFFYLFSVLGARGNCFVLGEGYTDKLPLYISRDFVAKL